MSHPVFISYARTTSRQHAKALYRELGELAFFDTSDIESGEQFPEALVDALLDAKVVVVFVDERYFQRWYCRKELETALKPFEILSTQPGQSQEKQHSALDGIVLALPPNQSGTVMTRLLHNFPPRIGTANWPMANDTEALVTLIRNRVETTQDTIGAALEKLVQSVHVRNALLEESALPPPSDLRSVRHSVLHGMPVSLRKGFVGRANELWTMHSALSGYEGEPEPAVALFAHGGFGKTRLAAEYVQRHGAARFQGRLFWINAERGKVGLEEQFYAILQSIGPHSPSLKELRDSGVQDAVANAMVDAVTEASQQGRVLVVVDNVPETQPAPLSTWCPAMGVAAVLATSRRNLALSPEGIKEVIVPPLTLSASIELLTRQIDRQALPDEDWRRIAEEWVGRFPLALELLNTTLQAGAITPQQLLKKADGTGPVTELDSQAAVLKEVIPQGMLRGVTEAFQISYEQMSPDAQKAAHLMVQLAPDPIPEILLEALDSDLLSPTVRTILRTRSIVMPVTGSTIPMFGTIHRVLADFLRSQPGETEEEIQILAGALQAIMTPEACLNPNQWALMNACEPHAEEVLSSLHDLRSKKYGATVPLLRLRLGLLASAQGVYGRAREHQEQAVAYFITNLSNEHPSTLIAMNSLALTLFHQGEYAEAGALQRQVLELRKRILGLEHPSTLTSLNNLALTLDRQGEYAEAGALQRQVLELRQCHLGMEHPDTLTAMGNLAATLFNQGEYAEASALQRQVLELRQRILGEEHPDALAAMSHLALTMTRQGKYAEAVALQRSDFELTQRILGEEHPDTLTAMSHLASTLAHQSDYAGAVALQRSVLERRKRILGEKHPDTQTAMNNLALTLFYQGQYAGAVAFQRSVLDLRQRQLGVEHPNTLTAMGNLALTLFRQGEYVEARALQISELERRKRILGEEHPDTLTAMGNLAGTLAQQGKYAEAVALQGMVVERTLRIHGKEHPATSLSAWNYMNTLLQSGDTETASRVQRLYLLWLLEHDPSTLGGSQQRIRAGVAKLLESVEDSQEE